MSSDRNTALPTANLQGLVKRGSLTKDKMNKAMSLLKGALDYSDFKDVDMVIEVNLICLMVLLHILALATYQRLNEFMRVPCVLF
jgi:3-hydroxyacyl-CoA dehydrogenase